MKHFANIVTTLFCSAVLYTPAYPQKAAVQDLFTDYERILHTEGILPVHNSTNLPFIHEYISRLDTLSSHPWRNIRRPSDFVYRTNKAALFLYDPELMTYWRNRRPGGINDGAMWQGRGFTTAITAGLYFRYRFLSVSLRPQLLYHQNRGFPLSRYPVRDGWSEYSNPFYRIDTPQRFGSKPFWVAVPGPTSLRLRYRGFEAGLSNEHRRWGPALQYPVVLSTNAPGFWHYFAATRTPKNILVGQLEATLLWGKLLESNYFDDLSFNDERFITGLNLSFNPNPLPHLTIGFSRVFYRTLPPEGIPVGNLFRTFDAFTKSKQVTGNNLSGNDNSSQMLSLYGRWVFPKSGLEFYGEWARNDHSWNFRDFLGEPEHSRAYMAGFQKTFTLSNKNIFAFNAEVVQLEASNTRDVRSANATWYAHSIVLQGYTHKGQLLGAGIGGGSNSQFLNGKYYLENGRLSGWIRRTVYNNDFLYRSGLMLQQPENSGLKKYWLHNFEIAFGTSLVYFINRWETQIGLELAREYNDDFIYKNDLTHIMVHLRLRYRLSPLR